VGQKEKGIMKSKNIKGKIKKKGHFINNFIKGWNKFQKLDKKILRTIRNVLSFALIMDLFLFFWYFNMRNVGVLLFIVIISGLLLTILAEQMKPQENNRKSIKNSKTNNFSKDLTLNIKKEIGGIFEGAKKDLGIN
jgi:hypothetical protein